MCVLRRAWFVVIVAGLFLISTPAWSQTARRPESTALAASHDLPDTVVVLNDAPIFGAADASREPLRMAKAGSQLNLLKQDGDWCQVQFQDPQFGRRVGYVLTKFVKINLARLQPVDLSVPVSEAVPAVTRTADETPRRPVTTARPAPRPGARVTPGSVDAGRSQPRGWINVDFARFTSSQPLQTFAYQAIVSREILTAASAYPALPGATGADVTGGATIGHGIGFGLHLDAANYESTVGLAITVPSPFFFNTPGIDASATAFTLKRRELGLDVSVEYTVPTPDRIAVRLFGGPTYFFLNNDMVEDIHYNQAASALIRLNVVAITSFTHREVSGSGLGYHAGGDVSVFFTRHVGVGGGVRYNRGTVRLREPLSEQNADFRVGHLELSGGLRLRF